VSPSEWYRVSQCTVLDLFSYLYSLSLLKTYTTTGIACVQLDRAFAELTAQRFTYCAETEGLYVVATRRADITNGEQTPSQTL
jgi:hypothetical protein